MRTGGWVSLAQAMLESPEPEVDAAGYGSPNLWDPRRARDCRGQLPAAVAAKGWDCPVLLTALPCVRCVRRASESLWGGGYYANPKPLCSPSLSCHGLRRCRWHPQHGRAAGGQQGKPGGEAGDHVALGTGPDPDRGPAAVPAPTPGAVPAPGPGFDPGGGPGLLPRWMTSW